MFNQLDYNFSRKLDFQRNLNLFKEKNLSDLGLNNIKKNLQKHLQFLMIDMYSSWRESKDQMLSVSMSKRGYKAKSRYNPNGISAITIEAVNILKKEKLINFFPGFFDSKRKVSRLTRISAKDFLIDYFKKFKFTPNELNNLRSKEYIFIINHKQELMEYSDNFETHEIREILKNYNFLLSKTFFDIPCIEKDFIQRADNSKIIISDYCKNSHFIFHNNINNLGKLQGNWWSKLDLMSIQKYSNHMIINDSKTSYIELSDFFLNFLQKFFNLNPVEINLEDIVKKFHFLNHNSQLCLLIEKLVSSKNFAGFKKSFWNIKRKMGIHKSVNEKDLELFIDYLVKDLNSLKKLIFSGKAFSWEAITSKIFLKLLKSFGTTNSNIPIIKVYDKFYYPTSLEMNVLEYFETVLKKELKVKIRLKTKNCYQYEASRSKSIFKKLVINNLNYTLRYKNNKKNFITSLIRNNIFTNHPMSKN